MADVEEDAVVPCGITRQVIKVGGRTVVRWRVRITVNGQRIHKGYYDTLREAIKKHIDWICAEDPLGNP